MNKLTQAAKGKTCTVRIPGYCNGNPETTVSAHLSGVRFGHGVGKKVNDILCADSCSTCHDVLDGRIKTEYTKEELKLMHHEGIAETLLRRVEEELIEVAA